MKLYDCKAESAKWLTEFYEEAGYNNKVLEDDIVYYAEENSVKLGVVRIAREHNVLVLRGMQVLARFQGQGIGTKLLEHLELTFGLEAVFCIPHDHLTEFYGKIGFHTVEPTEAPAFLAERLNSYIARNSKVLIMKRD
jgi:N-acetylglutamate synthase-like GNAT family acetyltransferase